MVSSIISSLAQPSLYCFSGSPIQTHSMVLKRSKKLLKFASRRFTRTNKRRLSGPICFFNSGEDSKESELEWPVLKRWDVPWGWQTASLTSLACGLSFALTGVVEAVALPYLGIQVQQLTLDEKAELLFLDQGIVTVVVLGVLYGISNTFKPLPDDLFRYDLREPFNLQKGWLLWAGISLAGAVSAIALTGAAMSLFNGEEPPQRETDALVQLLPLIGSSSISTACLVGITSVLAPLLEENVFRGFFMVSLTKWLQNPEKKRLVKIGGNDALWIKTVDSALTKGMEEFIKVPTPVAVIISAAVFALAHLTPGQFPQLFVLGTALGFSYAQTRNLLTPITIHAFWNSGVILLLTFLQLQGYDIKELLQAS
ncbi:hypothetical protein EZV62_017807 [Acer yangbiense]|uniref:CAAX prenyl protease 2/Lysostaphin resistance protein A-like domain-containing protein n=1 Tax=Acer yangbiense TaxID=1000413 RepID=A0A5C7HI14_9ROSI|nr:hypothetical protein EZV62_017807 [Acer yangbiense]